MHRDTFIEKLREVQQAVEQLLAELQASEHDKFAAHLYRSRRTYRNVQEAATFHLHVGSRFAFPVVLAWVEAGKWQMAGPRLMGPEGRGARESSQEPREPPEPQLGLVTVSPPQVGWSFAPSDRNSPAMLGKRYSGRRSVEV